MKRILFIGVLCLICSISVFSQSKKIWDNTQSLNSIAGYEDFLNKYPDGKYSEIAKLNLQELAYFNAEKINTIQVYEEFLLKYSQSQFASDARKRIDKLNLLHDLQIAKEANTIDAYRNFIKKYPDSYYIGEAQTNVQNLEWQDARNVNTVIVYEQFIKKYPENSHANEARTIIKELTTSPLVKSEEQQEVKKVNQAPMVNAKKNIKDSKLNFPAINSQKPDTIQLAADEIANSIRKVIAKIFKTRDWKLDLSINPDHPLKIYLSLDKDGETKLNDLGGLAGIPENIKSDISGKVNLQTKGMFSVNATPKHGYDSKVSGTMINSDNFVSCIQSGEFECGGYYFLKSTIPLYFEIGTIVFTDNEKPCTFSEGCIFVYNSVSYEFSNSKWIKK